MTKHEGGFSPLKTKRILLQVFTLCCCLALFSAGCGTSSSSGGSSSQKPLDNTTGTTSQTDTNSTTENSTGGGKVSTDGNNSKAVDDAERRILADRISRIAEAEEGVEDATVLIADAAGTNPDTAGSRDTTSNTGYTSGTNQSSSNAASSGSNSSGSGNQNRAAGPNSSTGSGTNANAKYVAIIGVVSSDNLQTDNTRQNELAERIRSSVLRNEALVQDVILTMDEKDLENIGSLANNLMEKTSSDTMDEVNRLRDDLSDAGTNLLNAAREITNGIGNGIKELAK